MADKASGLAPYSGLKASCSKCEAIGVEIHHCGGVWPVAFFFRGVRCPKGSVEHFHRKCKVCGFEWVEDISRREI
jgi:hypothetical protein